MDIIADLHMHTFYSDGTDSPIEVVNDAIRRELKCIAITDHDITEAYNDAKAYIEDKNLPLEIIAGVELSTENEGRDVHMLGYFADFTDEMPVVARLAKMREVRIERMREMTEILQGLNVPVSFDEVMASTNSKSIGRPHLAKLLVDKGCVSNIKEAFDKYLAEGRPAYFPKFKLPTKVGMDLIKESGGVPVLAHPMFTKVDEMIEGFVKDGLVGIEVHYANTEKRDLKRYIKIAQDFNLIQTGGSDYHGSIRPSTYIGKAGINQDLLDVLKARIKECHSQSFSQSS